EKSPHGPDESAVPRTELHAVPPYLPAQCVATFCDRVPGVHWGCAECVSHARVTLQREPGRTPCAGATESDALNLQLRNDVVLEGIFAVAPHGESRNRNRRGVHQVRIRNVVPGDRALV